MLNKKQSFAFVDKCLYCESENIKPIGQYMGSRFVGNSIGINHKVFATVFSCADCGKCSEWTETDVLKVKAYNDKMGF